MMTMAHRLPLGTGVARRTASSELLSPSPAHLCRHPSGATRPTHNSGADRPEKE